MQMKFLSYNIHGARSETPGARPDVARIAEVIRGYAPDFVALQEVHRWLPPPGVFQDQPAQLRKQLGMEISFGPTLGSLGAGYGNGILARVQPEEVGNLRLPGEGEPRCALMARFGGEGGPFWFWSTHLALSPEVRLRQCDVLAQELRIAGLPVVLAGDLNATPDSPELALLLDAGFHHCVPPHAPTFPASSPLLRLDYLLATEHFGPGRWEVGESLASDHRPVFATATLS